jgi:hypothetical protein
MSAFLYLHLMEAVSVDNGEQFDRGAALGSAAVARRADAQSRALPTGQ